MCYAHFSFFGWRWNLSTQFDAAATGLWPVVQASRIEKDEIQETEVLPSAAAMLNDAQPESAPQEEEDSPEVVAARHSAFSKIRGRLKLRSMANTWRRRANDKALPALRPFIPRLLRGEMLDMAQWYRSLYDCIHWLTISSCLRIYITASAEASH